MNCEYCARYNKIALATHIIAESPMCDRCFHGAHPLDRALVPSGRKGLPRIFDDAQLGDIRVALRQGQTQRSLAEHYGCSQWVIYRIKREMVLAGEMAPCNKGQYSK